MSARKVAKNAKITKQTKLVRETICVGPMNYVIDPCLDTPSGSDQTVQMRSTGGMMLIPKLLGADLGKDQQAIDQQLSGIISKQIRRNKFTGETGTTLLIDTELNDMPHRYFLIVGIGSPQQFGVETVCNVYKKMIDQATKLKVPHVTIPFPKMRATSSSGITLPGMTNILQRVINEKFAPKKPKRGSKIVKKQRKNQQLSSLKEIVLQCGRGAKHHLKQGLLAQAQ